MRSDPSHLSEKLIIFTMGFRLRVVCVCECWGEECGTGKQIGPKIEVVLGDVCVWRGGDPEINFPGRCGQLSLGPSSPDSLPSKSL